MKVLENTKDAPKDLRAKSLRMAGILLELTKKAKKGQGVKMAQKILESGKARAKMMEMIKAQGEQRVAMRPGNFKKDILAQNNGKVVEIDNKLISRIARTAGAPIDKQAGIYIYKKLNDKVKKGDVLYTIYADNKERLLNAEIYGPNKAYTIK